MEASQVFRFTRISLHQLTDLGHFAPTSLDTKMEFKREMLSPISNFTSRRTSTECRAPCGSFLSLRTFYAFGARSGRTPSLQRSLSYNTCSSSFGTGFLLQSSETNSILQRSSTATSIQRLKHRIAYHNRYLKTISNVFKPYSSSMAQTHISSISPLSTSQKRDYQQHQQMKTRQFILPKLPRSTITTKLQNPTNAQSTSNRHENHTRTHFEQPVKATASVEKKNETTTLKEDSVEMTTLIERNKSLEAEVERLRCKLRDKERMENELRRKVLEYAAEIKVWKNKCEMQQRATHNKNSEPKGNNEEISDIMEQLNSAAEKLTRLNAVKDLKLLQSEMETALKEISK